MAKLTHVSSSGEARMVDISQKGDTHREAVARGTVTMKPDTLEQIKAAKLKKGDVVLPVTFGTDYGHFKI